MDNSMIDEQIKTFVTSSCLVTSCKLQVSCQSPRQASQWNTGTLEIVTGLSFGLISIGRDTLKLQSDPIKK